MVRASSVVCQSRGCGSVPELPEVETVARVLHPLVAGRTIVNVVSIDTARPADLSAVRGAAILGVRRVGKEVVFDLTGPAGPLWLRVHLRMTGRLVFADDPTDHRRRFARFVLVLDRGGVVLDDARRFGTAFVDRAPPVAPGLDPVTPAFTPARLAELIRGVRAPVKALLLRQDRITGLGNIYASEILFAAGIAPDRPAGTLSRAAVARLHGATVDVLSRAIDACGTTFRDFQDAVGDSGGFQHFLQVYGREGEPCRRCGTPIRRRVQQQRSTFDCPRCQRR